MSLGILTNIAAIYAENNLNQTQSSLQNTLTQLSSGSRINSGADDAAGLSVVDGLQANVSALTQSSQNASDGIGLLQTADGALSQVTNLLNRAVTLATEAANGTLNTNQVSSANAEYQNILSEIGDIGSSTNFNGNSVFTSTSKTVFVSDGTTTGSDSYNEVVGTLSDSTVGETGSGAGTLATPTASAPTATTSLQSAVAVTTPSTVPVVPTVTAPVGTTAASSSASLYSGSNLTTSNGSVTYGGIITGAASPASGTLGTNGYLNTSNGSSFTPSSLTAVEGNATAFTSSDTYSGTIGVQTAGSSTIYSATVAAGSSLNTVVSALNSSFGYSSANGTFGASGLKAANVNNALVITSNGSTGSGTVIVDDPVNALQVTTGGVTTSVNFGGTANQATVSGTQSNTYSLSGLGADGLNGTLNIYSGNGASASTNPVASINFGTDTAGTAAASVQTTINTALAASGYSATYNSGAGTLTITGPTSLTGGFSVGSGTGAQSFQAATAVDASTSIALGTPLPTTSGTALASTYTAASVTAGAASGSFGAADTYTGNIQVQLAGSNTTYTVSANASSLSSVVSSLNAQFGSSGAANDFGTAGLEATISNHQLVITSAGGSGQVVVNGGATTLKVAGVGFTGSQSLTFSGTGASHVVGGYTASAPTAASAASVSLALGNGSTSDAAEGTLNVYSGANGTGALVGTINFGTNGTNGAAAIASTVATASTNFIDGYSAAYTGGNLVITGPSNGNSFSVSSATSGNTELQAGTITPTVNGGTTTLTTGSLTASASTVYTGTIDYGVSNAYVIPPGGLTEGDGGASLAALNSALTSANSGITASFNGNNQLTFTSNTTTAPNITLSGVTATNPGSTTYAASTASFAPTNAATGTFSGTISVGTGSASGSNGNIALISSTIAANSTLAQVVSQLNTQYQNAGVQTNNNGTLTGLVASAGSNGNLVLTGPVPAANASPSVVAADKLTFGATTDLSSVAGAQETLTNANAASGTLYTGTINFGAVGTTAAGSYTIAAAGQTAAQIAAALNTSQYLGTAATGVQASVNSSNELVFTGPTSGSGEGAAPGVTLSNVVATAPAVTSYSQSTAAFAPTNAGGTFSGTLVVGTAGTSAVTTTVAANTTLNNLVTQLNNQYLTAGNGIVASAGTGSAAGELILTGPQTANNASAATAANNQLTFGAGTSLVASGGSTNGVDFTQSNVSTLTASSAQTVLTAVTTAINDVAYQRGLIGADVNELTAASNVASAESVNLTSAQSSIQSTDYGAATSNLAKYQVLSQTGISALAQANSVQQEVLKLLQ
jgi:flagellin